MSSSASPRYKDNIYASMTSPPKRSQQSDHFDDLIGNLGRPEKVEPTRHSRTKSPRDIVLPLAHDFVDSSIAGSNKGATENNVDGVESEDDDNAPCGEPTIDPDALHVEGSWD
ncbi:hypothetical protein L6452_44114 [Arctium lappa]|uniref:Uncharacterized protein n=1 Tax=Arctium lappa TaxID=4217 RepID=A0ACB8XFK4_ARCLA|nr:hypothetical protein L6452_44114 [Arctium lappa]